QEATIRSAISRLRFQELRQLDKWIEPDDSGAIGNKVGEGIDVIVVKLAIAVINDVFHAAYLDVGVPHDPLYRMNDLVWGRIAFHSQARLGSVNRAGGAW